MLSFHSDGSVQYRGFDLSFFFFPLGEFLGNVLSKKCSNVKVGVV